MVVGKGFAAWIIPVHRLSRTVEQQTGSHVSCLVFPLISSEHLPGHSSSCTPTLLAPEYRDTNEWKNDLKEPLPSPLQTGAVNYPTGPKRRREVLAP